MARPAGYDGVFSDGRFIYFAPYQNGEGWHGTVLRYDLTMPFTSETAWALLDAKAVLGAFGGYVDGVVAGKLVCFAPHVRDGAILHGQVLCYDRDGDFSNGSSWYTYAFADSLECAADPTCEEPVGYDGAAFDGRFIYYAPHSNSTGMHGEVLRYDALVSTGIPTTSEWGLAVFALLTLTAGTLISIRRDEGSRPL